MSSEKLEEENEEFRRWATEARKGPIEDKNKRQRRSALCGEKLEEEVEELRRMLALCIEADASPMRHSLAIPRGIPKKTKGLLGIKTKSEKKLWELKNSQDFEDKESELKRRDPLVGHVKKTCYMPVIDLNFGNLSRQPVEEL